MDAPESNKNEFVRLHFKPKLKIRILRGSAGRKSYFNVFCNDFKAVLFENPEINLCLAFDQNKNFEGLGQNGPDS